MRRSISFAAVCIVWRRRPSGVVGRGRSRRGVKVVFVAVILHREIQNRKRGWHMVRLRIDENIIPAGEPQREQAARFRNIQAESSGIEFFRRRDVSRRKTAECLTVFYHTPLLLI